MSRGDSPTAAVTTAARDGAAKAAERAGAAEHTELRALLARMRAATEAGDALGASDLGRQLHRRIQEISGQRTALRTIERLRRQLVRHQFRLALRPGRARQSLAEHAALVEAVASGDPNEAEAAMRAHLRQVARELGPGSSAR
jgi:DNA-binding GntR family transcriptional regulator